MNSADAKKPKFDGAWWKKNKAEAADPKGELEAALVEYQKRVETFFKATRLSASGDEAQLKKALQEIKKAAKAEQGNKKLGVLQKETLTALANYEKRADAAIIELKRLETAPVMTASLKLLVQKMPQFESYCKKNYQEESYNFLSLMYKNPKPDRQWYDDFIADNAKFQINLPAGVKAKFDAVAEDIEKHGKPDNRATWDEAPWDNAVKEIEKMLVADVLNRFHYFMTGEMMKDSLPND